MGWGEEERRAEERMERRTNKEKPGDEEFL
jgi:hypothetical protein